MKRYMLFAGDFQYPRGGWKDFRDSFDDIDMAKQLAKAHQYEWWQVIDNSDGRVVADKYDF